MIRCVNLEHQETYTMYQNYNVECHPFGQCLPVYDPIVHYE